MVHAKVKLGFVAHPASILVRWFKLSLNLLLYPAKIAGIKQAETQQFGEQSYRSQKLFTSWSVPLFFLRYRVIGFITIDFNVFFFKINNII